MLVGGRGRARALLAAAAMLISAAAFAQPSAAVPVTLDWVAPAGCPPAESVLAEIRGMLRSSGSAQKQVTARAVVTHAGAGFRVTLSTTTDGAHGERQFAADSCQAIARATALILALAVDPTAKPPPPIVAPIPLPPPPVSPAPLPPPPPSPPPASPPPAPSAPASATSPPVESAAPATPSASATPTASARPPPPSGPRKHVLALATSAGGDLGTLPSPAVGIEVAIAWVPDPLRFEVAGSYWGGQTSSLAARPIGGNFQLLTLAARGCYALLTGALDLGPCLGGELDRMSASGFGGLSHLDGASTWSAITGGALLSWSVFPPFALRLAIEAVAPLARPQFVVEVPPPGVSQPVHRASVIGGRGVLGGELRFF